MRSHRVPYSRVLLGVTLLALSGSSRLMAEEPVYFEPVVPVEQHATQLHATPPATEASSWGLSEEELIRLRGGLTYLNHETESHLGGTYGLDGIVPLTEIFGVHWAARANQFSGATQWQGTLGLYKNTDLASGDRIGATLFYDGFNDSRGDDFYLDAIRGQVGYAVSDIAAVGITYAAPLHTEEDVGSLTGDGIATYRAVSSGSVFVSRYFGEQLAQLGVGYRELPDSLFIDLSYRRPLVDDRTFLYANGNYIEESGAFSTWVGVEFRFGKGGSRNASPAGRRGVWDDPTIANSFNWGENNFWQNTNNPANMDNVPLPVSDKGPPR